MSALSKIPMTLEGILKMLEGASPSQLEELEKLAAPKLEKPWLAQPGPQSDAYHSEADETLYGGAAGGGKTDLLLGLATTAHKRSVIFRSQAVDLVGLWQRLTEIVPAPAKTDTNRKSMITPDGRFIETGHLELPGSERAWMGRPHDLIGFDEAALINELRVNFVIQWLRSTDPAQRKRVVFATNPPLPEIRDGITTDTPVGDWLLRWFAPWVDDTYPNPAKPGELRWCYMRAIGDQLETVWVEGPGVYSTETGRFIAAAVTDEQLMSGVLSTAKSRTFFPSLVKDNVYLQGTGYVEKLSGQPEPMRSMLMRGAFNIKGADHPFQVIPTAWVLAAQERWRVRMEQDRQGCLRLRQLVLYCDIAQGGVDMTVLAPLDETDFYEELVVAPGSDTPDGHSVVSLLLGARYDQSLIALDMTGGWGGATHQSLADQKIEAERHNASESDGSWEPFMNYKYLNNRAKMWWEFRLALDPKSGFEIALPPSSRLQAQLTTPHFFVKGKILQVESKDEIRKRLQGGGSTDEADAVLGAWQFRERALAAQFDPVVDLIEEWNGRGPKDLEAEERNYDPLRDWS